MRIEINRREVYGNVRYYPVNGVAKALAKIAGTKTLSIEVLQEAAFSLNGEVFVTEPEALALWKKFGKM
jgi:hypothetical protein